MIKLILKIFAVIKELIGLAIIAKDVHEKEKKTEEKNEKVKVIKKNYAHARTAAGLRNIELPEEPRNDPS